MRSSSWSPTSLSRRSPPPQRDTLRLVRGYGNYRFAPQVERKPATLLIYRGQKAVVRFHDGTTYAIPAPPLRKLDVKPQQRFVLVVTRVAGDVRDVRVEPLAAARPRRTRRPLAKVLVRDGRAVSTRT